MRFILFCFLLGCAPYLTANAQTDSLPQQKSNPASDYYQRMADSTIQAEADRQKFVEDSVTMYFLAPDPNRENQFLNDILKTGLMDVLTHSPQYITKVSAKENGTPRNSRDPLIIGIMAGLLVYTALLNMFLGNDMRNVIRSFYDKHALSQVDKEGGLINSWAFIGLFLLFSLTAGFMLYQLAAYYNVYYTSLAGFRLFITLSLAVSVLFALKFVVLKLIGFVFDAGRLVSEYISVLNLTYFNIAFVLLISAVCFSLLGGRFIQPLLAMTLVSVVVIFAWQYLRNSVSVISNFRFRKFYLFIYLCALEICPVLILIKALNI